MANRAEHDLRAPAHSAGAAVEPARVFISYASADKPIADAVCAALEAAGIRCWIAPRDVRPGALYADAIVRAINDAQALVLVLSESSNASSHVGKEVERASSKRRPIIALRTDSAPLTPALKYFLSESQWIDASASQMESAYAKLIDAIRDPPSSGIGDAVSVGTGSAGPLSARGSRTWKTAGIAVLLAVAAIIGLKFVMLRQPPSANPILNKSIAVLPFVDLSEKKDQEYFADGMAEEILDLLAKIPGLTVIGRTSSFQFKGRNEDLRTIGAQLNAAYVLEGSVRNAGDRVRITTQLINTRTGTHEWSETYERHIGDVLALQDAIAAAVVRELQLTVDAGFTSARSLKNEDAYDLILRGRHAADRLDKDGLDEAVRLFQHALKLDPTSADAAAALARAYDAQGEWGFVAPKVAFEQARRAATAALQLDSNGTLAHYVLGRLHLAYDWDWAAAEREFQQVSALAPGKGDAINSEALLSMALGRWDDVLSQVKAALAQDPLDPPSLYVLTEVQMHLGHLVQAEAAIRRALDIRPTLGGGHYLLGLVLLARGDREAALIEMQRETADFQAPGGLAIAYSSLGRRADADSALAEMLKQHADDGAFIIAEVYAFRGQTDEVMNWLERAYEQKDSSLYFLKVEMPQTALASDSRFKAFLHKMNLPE